MPRDRDLQRDADDVGTWLRENGDRFPPLRILRVTPAVIVDEFGAAAIELTVVLEDPADLDEGWPVDATFALYGAVQDRAASTEHGAYAYVHLQPETACHAS